MGSKFAERLPSLSEMIQYYGPYLGLVLSLIIAILILQYIWFSRTLKAKNDEIKRLSDKEQTLYDRIIHMIDEGIGSRKKIK